MPSDVTAEEAFDTAEMKQTTKKKEAPLLKSGGQSSLLTSVEVIEALTSGPQGHTEQETAAPILGGIT